MELGKTAYVILGMLSQGARSGYDIKAKADVSTRFFWAISYGQIYPELKRLERAGLIAGEAEPTGGRRRNSYSLTPAGEQALHDWLAGDGEIHFELRHEGILRFFFADALDRDEQVELLRRIRAEHERVLGELERIQPVAERLAGEGGGIAPLLTLETGIAYQEFFIDLCDRLERRVSDLQSPSGGT
ncbi:MAG: PadR family transcriptional regulator [Thermoleophilaceae bacterium]